MNKKIFDPIKIPISGINLIEASAGTGKTHSISNLFARLIVKENIDIEKILVVTFTKDATAELKIRIRTNLLNILDTINKENSQAEEFIKNLINTLDTKQKKKNAIEKIQVTLNNFDNANIFTIHSFCLKILTNYSHLCNCPSQIKLNNNKEFNKILQISHDFWRNNVLNNNILLNLFFDKEIKIENILYEILSYINKPYIKYKEPIISLEDLQKSNDLIDKKLIDVQQNISNIKQSFNEIKDYINKKKFQKIEELFLDIEKNQLNDEKIIEKLKKFEKNYIKNEGLLKKYKEEKFALEIFNNEIFKNLNKLYELGINLEKKEKLTEEIILKTKFELLEYINAQLTKIKNNSENRNYDDLLIDLHSCINKKSSNSDILIDILKNTWQVALIDEFQDTDKLQYEIFKKIFIENKITTFLVGDPKQAIYKFRGADISTYLSSIKDIDNYYTLNVNYRSNENLVNAINFIFNQTINPFVLDKIKYTEIKANKKNSDFLPQEADMNIFALNELEEIKELEKSIESKNKIKTIVAEKCAQHINYLLNNYDNLKTYDIAILVSNHKEASLINNALKKFKINSKTINKESIFESEEVYAINAMIEFWINPQNINNLSFLLTSSIFNYNENELNNILNNQDELNNLTEISNFSKNILKEKGFYNAFNFFENKLNIFSKLLLLEKNRTITNINHIIELLSQQEVITGNYILTIDWLKKNIQQHQKNQNKNYFNDDEYLLKLENDDLLIQIVTIHSAKGLQYKIVFCPFLWDCNINNKEDFKTINQDDKILLISKKINNKYLPKLEKEELSERLRLTYVALTRAQEKLYIYIYTNANNKDTPFEYLLSKFHTEKNYSWNTWNTWYNNINSPKYINLSNEIPSCDNNKENNNKNIILKPPLKFTRKYLHSIKNTSFSFITKSNNFHENYNKDDLIVDLQEIEKLSQDNIDLKNEVNDIFSFPKGIDTGLCWHSILEKFNFQLDANEQLELIKNQLLFYDFKEDILLKITINMLNNVRLCKLKNDTSLSQIKNYLTEVKFVLKINNLDFNKIKEWILNQNIFKNTNIVEHLKDINLKSMECFLEGFIDLIFIDTEKNFYLIDYKSNYLGDSIEKYSTDNLTNSMLENHYYLQAIIYSLSIYRYLSYNQFKFENIKIRYIYLRGLNNKYKKNGIWKWDLKKEDLDDLNKMLSLTNYVNM